MKFLIQVIATAIAAFALELFLPWWSVALAAFALGYLLKSKQNFLAGFLAIAFLWGVYAFLIDFNGAAPLADRVAAILTINKTLLFAVTAFIGGLVGGFAALSGSLLRKEKRKSLYY